MKPVKLLIRSFGCQMNKLDSALVIAALKDMGMEPTESIRDADVVVINTCSVRGHAEDRVLSHLGHLKHLRKNRPELVVAVIGCMAQRLGNELLRHPAVDIVAGPAQIPHLGPLIRKTLDHHDKQLAVTPKIRQVGSDTDSQSLDDFEFQYDSDADQPPRQAFIRVMRGCNKFCSYCVVPYVRGPEQSRSSRVIVEQARKLAGQGVRQITLLGQTVNSYHYAEDDRTIVLADLLEQISQIDGIRWIRFITSHPRPFDETIFHVMASNPKICRYLHIPAQSGSDTILRAMHRGYSVEEYIGLIHRARQIVPDIAVAGDFIVGFPGETEDDFEATMNLVRQIRYKTCFIFKYSPRPGTHADKKLADTVSEEVKKQRNMALLDLQNQISEQDNQRFIGRVVDVLVEGPSKNPHLDSADSLDMPQLIARSAEDYIVVFHGRTDSAGTFQRVRILRSSALTLFGRLEH